MCDCDERSSLQDKEITVILRCNIVVNANQPVSIRQYNYPFFLLL